MGPLERELAIALVSRYFQALEVDDRDLAAEQFEDDATYSHPPFGDGARAEVRGRAAIRALFDERGRRTTVHTVTALAGNGTTWFVEGLAHPEAGAPPHASFVSVVRLGPTGRIASYVAYTAQPPATTHDPG